MSDAQAYALSDLVERFSTEYKETHRSQPLQFTNEKEKEKENVVNKEKENERNNENENENGGEDEEYPDDYDEGKMIR